MGCGRSKQHSPKPGSEERDLNNSKEKNTGKKKKSKGEKKENKDPQQSSGSQKSLLAKMSPVKTIVNSLKPPPPNLNGSPKQTVLLLDIDYPTHHKHKEMDRLSVPPNREVKEFRGKQNFRVTHSQIAFFEMLDQKIEQGEDYHSEHSIEITPADDS